MISASVFYPNQHATGSAIVGTRGPKDGGGAGVADVGQPHWLLTWRSGASPFESLKVF